MTATIVEEEVDTDITSMLDFLQPPQCEIANITKLPECVNAAEFKMVLSCCAEMWLMCEDHMLMVVNEFKKMRMVEHDPAVGGCGGKFVKFTIIERI